jgi:hypothetical protein
VIKAFDNFESIPEHGCRAKIVKESPLVHEDISLAHSSLSLIRDKSDNFTYKSAQLEGNLNQVTG